MLRTMDPIDLIVRQVRQLMENGREADAVALLAHVHPADQADVIERVGRSVFEAALRHLSAGESALILENLTEPQRSTFLARVDPDLLAAILDELPQRATTDILQGLPVEHSARVLALLEDGRAIGRLLNFPRDSAGGLMTPVVSLLRDSWTVGDAIAYLRQQESASEEQEFFVVDGANRLRGAVTPVALLLSRPTDPISQIMRTDIIAMSASDQASEASARLRRYDLRAVPVVSDEGVLIGTISATQGLEARIAQDTQEMYGIANLSADESVQQSARAAFPGRLFWLTVNLGTVLLAAATVGAFQSTISRAAAIAVFMPVVVGMGGNSATQIVTLVVRALSLQEMGTRHVMDILRKECVLAAGNALVLGGGVGIAAWLWQGNEWLGLIVAIAMSANLLLAGVAGVLVPVGIKLMRSDPALSSAIIVTTFTDVIGFLVLLGLATLLISQVT